MKTMHSEKRIDRKNHAGTVKFSMAVYLFLKAQWGRISRYATLDNAFDIFGRFITSTE